MESLHLWATLIIASLAIIHLVQAQDQKGFISLDCGLPPSEVSPYIHPDSGLKFTSDADFIQSGKLGKIEKKQEKHFGKTRRTLRYFPDGMRNCYRINVTQGMTYLIRANFAYGNYDEINHYPKFDLHIGPNFWTTIDLASFSTTIDLGSTTEEIVHIPRSEFLDVCLVKTYMSTPFISSLVLRPLPKNTYINPSGSMKTRRHIYATTTTETDISFPDDAYDRTWFPFIFPDVADVPPWFAPFVEPSTQITTNLKANNSGSYVLPQAVITTAVIPGNASKSLKYTEYAMSNNDNILLFLHLSEVQELGVNETREFDILWNKEPITESFRPAYLQPKTFTSKYPVVCPDNNCLLELIKTNKSTLPPLLNAIETFVIVESPQSDTDKNDVLAIRNIKETYGIKKITWQGDPCVPPSFLWHGLSCKVVDSTPPIITSLDLSSSGLTGTIAVGFRNLTHLEKLDLSNNSLVGVVPEYLANMKSLSFLNLSMNNLNGSIPQALCDRQKKGLQIIFDGDLNSSGSCARKKKFPVLIIVAVVASLVVVIVIILVIYFVSKLNRAINHIGGTDTSIETKRRKFSYLEVREMTKNLERPLGEGGFGIVYHGHLNGSQVAVKLLSRSSTQGYKEFKAEVDLLLRVHHINLVSLVGYCNERDHLALIYEYMPYVDLRHHLSGKAGAIILSWGTRLQIAVGSALGLEYLHNGCRPPMVHRDIKSTNILLDENFTAKIADFGLSRSFQAKEESHVSTVVAGTPGYLDPEYYRTGRLAEMSDVYSFGVVLLEIMTNQRVIDQTRENSHITEWAASMVNRGDITKIMDPNLNGDYNTRSVWRALELALSCANPSSENRPNMSQVVVELKECLNSENKTKSKNQDVDSSSSVELSMSIDANAPPSAR